MSQINIGNVTGNNNIFGDKNKLRIDEDKRMAREEIIRDEAVNFVSDVSQYADGYSGHKEFINNLKEELLNFYDPESKMIFLDEVKVQTEIAKQTHVDGCIDKECTKDVTYKKILFYIDQEISELPKILKDTGGDIATNRTKVFISYSQKDKSYLDDMKRHFKPLKNIIDFWDDSKIEAGQKWKEEIKSAIQEAKIAVLLLSADFFNSDFISENELPPLLELAKKEGATILTVILKPCLFEEYPQLNQYQAINNPSRPISSMNETNKEFMWVELVRQIKNIVTRDKK